MRSLILGFSFGSAAVVLQGCGINNGSSSTCRAASMQFTSQIIKGTLSSNAEMSTHLPNGTVLSEQQNETGAYRIGVSFEKFNFFVKVTDAIVTVGPAIVPPIELNSTTIFDAAKKMMALIEDMRVTLPNGTRIDIRNCTYATISDLLPVAVLTQFLQWFKSNIGGEAVCGGNDGNFDKWTWSVDSRTLPPIPALNFTLPAFQVSASLRESEEGKLGSMRARWSVSGDLPDKKTHMTIHEERDADISSAILGGPSEADLAIPAACTKIDTHALLKQILNHEIPLRTFKQIAASSVVYRQFSDMIQAALKSRHQELVVV